MPILNYLLWTIILFECCSRNETDFLSLKFSVLRFYLVVAIATMRYCRGVERIPEHIPVVIFVSFCVDSEMFAKSSVFPRTKHRFLVRG